MSFLTATTHFEFERVFYSPAWVKRFDDGSELTLTARVSVDFTDIRMSLVIEEARALSAQLLTALAEHDAATRVDLVKAAA
ncbi:hypothetical protein NONI108955_36135 [Nocardia ninae]|uniref:Uncharacterized protein n=1 Tax=Nocardia ninae NBRC 108245 TaxID=1210091 RepID=A0A511MLN2_9NOCA|nr:hypothetical protein [Nocardia ninae]GEM41529.1 hypothetical protein NN4_60480 [Nocardia ninae NBRC 108245]